MQILPNLFFGYQKKKKNVTSTLINGEKDTLKSSCFTVIAITFFFFFGWETLANCLKHWLHAVLGIFPFLICGPLSTNHIKRK